MGLGKTLNASEQRLLEGAVGSGTIHCSAIARIYKNSGNSWEKVCMGACSILSEGNSNYIKVVDLNNRSVCFAQELYENFEYAKPRDFFHTFEGDRAIYGVSFADQEEAEAFYDSVVNLGSGQASRAAAPPVAARPFVPPPPSTPRPPVPQDSHGSYVPPAQPPPPSTPYQPPPPSTPYQPPVAPAATVTPAAKKPPKKKKSFFSKLLGQEEEEELIISEPQDFRHLSSIGWNPGEGSFEIRNIPPEWRKLFQAAGIKKSELKNKDTAAFLVNIIEQNGGVAPADLETAMGGGGPPPPPPPSGGAPPPPPPPSGAPPPPGPPPPSRPGAPAPPASGGRGALLDAIQRGTSLKPVTPGQGEAEAPPATVGLADTLARAMEARRAAIKTDVDEEESEAWSDEEWSDE